MNKYPPRDAYGAPAYGRRPQQDSSRSPFETSPLLQARSDSSNRKQAAELAQLKEMEATLREMLDRVELPQVWNNRLFKQLRNVEKSRSRF